MKKTLRTYPEMAKTTGYPELSIKNCLELKDSELRKIYKLC